MKYFELYYRGHFKNILFWNNDEFYLIFSQSIFPSMHLNYRSQNIKFANSMPELNFRYLWLPHSHIFSNEDRIVSKHNFKWPHMSVLVSSHSVCIIILNIAQHKSTPLLICYSIPSRLLKIQIYNSTYNKSYNYISKLTHTKQYGAMSPPYAVIRGQQSIWTDWSSPINAA